MLKLLLIIKLNPSWSRKESVNFYSPNLFAWKYFDYVKRSDHQGF